MAKHYQDPDPLHGNGKAIPHPKKAVYKTASKKEIRSIITNIGAKLFNLCRNQSGIKNHV